MRKFLRYYKVDIIFYICCVLVLVLVGRQVYKFVTVDHEDIHEISFVNLSQYESEYEDLADEMLDYFKEVKKEYGDVLYIECGLHYEPGYMRVKYCYSEPSLNEEKYVQWDEDLKTLYDTVAKGTVYPRDYGGEGKELMIFVSKHQVDFRFRSCSLIYRSDFKKPNMDHVHEDRISRSWSYGIRWWLV